MGALWETHPESEDPGPWYSDPRPCSKSAGLGPGSMQQCLRRAKGVNEFVEVWCRTGTVLFRQVSRWSRHLSAFLMPVGHKDA